MQDDQQQAPSSQPPRPNEWTGLDPHAAASQSPVQAPLSPAPAVAMPEAQPQAYAAAAVAAPAAKSTTRTIVEFGGVLLALILLVAMMTGITQVVQIALVTFAVIGVYAVIREASSSTVTKSLDFRSNPATPPPVYGAAPVPTNTRAKIIKRLGITVLLIAFSVFVLPWIAMMLFFFIIVGLGGGRGS
jgi:hypothetical protein